MSEKKNNIDLKVLFQNALNDPTLFSDLDIKKLLESLENVKNDYLENKTIDSITTKTYNKLNELKLPREKIVNYCKKLQEYRFVDTINELHLAKHIFCIRNKKKENNDDNNNNDNKVQNMFGGIVLNILFKDNGTFIVIRNQFNKFYQIKYDNFFIFQKMGLQEHMILLAQGTYGSIETPPLKKTT